MKSQWAAAGIMASRTRYWTGELHLVVNREPSRMPGGLLIYFRL